jgi:hypothetical protein
MVKSNIFQRQRNNQHTKFGIPVAMLVVPQVIMAAQWRLPAGHARRVGRGQSMMPSLSDLWKNIQYYFCAPTHLRMGKHGAFIFIWLISLMKDAVAWTPKAQKPGYRATQCRWI